MITTASPTASTTPSATMQHPPPPPPPPPPAPPHSAIRSSSSGSDSSARSGRGRLNPRTSLDSDAGHGTTFKSISAPSTPRLQPAETSYEDIRIHFPRLQRAHNPPGAASAPSSRPVSTVPSLALVQQTLGGLLAGGSSSNTQQPLHATAPGSNLTVATTAAAESRRTSGWSDSASPTGSVSAGATTTGRLAAARARILRAVGSHQLFELLALTDAVTALSLALWAWTALEPAQAAIGALDMVTVALARTICLVLVGRGYVTAATPASVCLTSLVYALGKTVALASVPGALDGPATAPFLIYAIVAPVLEWTVSATAHATDAVAHWPAALRRASRSALAETGDLAATPAPAPSARLTSGRGTTRGKSGRGKRTPSSKRPLLASDEFNSLEYRTFLGAAGPSNAPAAPPSEDDQPARRARSFTFSGKPTTGGAAPDTPWLATSPPPAVPRPRPRPANRPPPNKNPNRWSVAVFDAAHLPHLDVGPFPVPPLPATLAPPPGPFSSSPVATTASGLSARGVSPTPSLSPQVPRTPPALAPAVTAVPSSGPGGLAAQSVAPSRLNVSGSLGTSAVPAAAAAAWTLLPPPATSSTPTAVPPMSAVPAHVRRAVGGGHAAGDDADDEDEVDLTARLFSSRSVMGSSYGATSTGTVLSPSEGESEDEDGFETGTTDDDDEEPNEPSSKSLTPRSGPVAHAHAASGVQASAAGALGARPTLSDDTSATETEEESYDDEDEDDEDDDDDDDANSVLLHVPRPWVHELGSASDRSPSRSPSRRARSRSAHRQRSRSARSRSARRRPTATAVEPAAPETPLAETPVSRPPRPVSSRIISTPASEDDTDADADEHRDTRPRARKFLTPATAESPRRMLRRTARTIASPATDTLPHAPVAFETSRRSWSSDDDDDDDDETVAAAAMSPPPRRVRLNVDVDGVAVVPLVLDRDGVDMLGDPVPDAMADSGVVFAASAVGSTVDA